MNELLLRNAQKGVAIPSDDNDHAWQRRYSWVVQAALSDTDSNMSPSEAGVFARGAVSKEFKDVNPESDLPSCLSDE